MPPSIMVGVARFLSASGKAIRSAMPEQFATLVLDGEVSAKLLGLNLISAEVQGAVLRCRPSSVDTRFQA